MSRFRVVTYNIHKSKGLDLRSSPRRIADVLRELEADVIALQEVVARQDGKAEENQARFIADELGFDYRMTAARRHQGAPYGNAVLSRLPIVGHWRHDVSVEKYEPRACQQVDVKLNAENVLHLYNLHLGTSFFERRKQAKRLLAADVLDRPHPFPRILLGDFNEYTRGLASKLLQEHFQSADPREHFRFRRSYPGVLPLIHLDHIYYDSPLKIQKAFIHRSRLSLVASDHLPLAADFSLEI